MTVNNKIIKENLSTINISTLNSVQSNNRMTVLVTGATGFLGSKIVEKLIDMSINVVILKRETSDICRIAHLITKCKIYNIESVSFLKILKENNVKVIVHTAASYGRNNENIKAIIESNLTFPLELLKSAMEVGVPKFINTGTSLLPCVNEYSLSKNQFTQWLRFYQNNISIQDLVLEYFYGPGDDAWKFVTMIMNKFNINSPSIDLTSGEQMRDFIFIDDVVSAYLILIQESIKSGEMQSFNVGSSNPLSIKELVLLCKNISKNKNTKLNFGSIPQRDFEINYRKCDINDIAKLGWSPKTSLENGLEITWNYIKKNNLQ